MAGWIDGPFRGGGMREGGGSGGKGIPPWVILFALVWLAVCVLGWMWGGDGR